MVYDKDHGGYTENSENLSKEFTNLVEDLILKYMNQYDLNIEEIKYITSNDIDKICLKNMLQQRLK